MFGRRSFSLVVLFFTAACGPPDRPGATDRVARSYRTLRQLSTAYPWWLDAQFDPADTVIASLPIQRIDTTWERASELSWDLLPPAARSDPSMLADSSAVFEHDGDFNRDGQQDLALVGVYREHTGDLGRFLLVLTAGPGDEWIVVQLEKISGSAGFSVLLNQPNEIIWSVCMECDTASRLTWDGAKYVWEGAPAP